MLKEVKKENIDHNKPLYVLSQGYNYSRLLFMILPILFFTVSYGVDKTMEYKYIIITGLICMIIDELFCIYKKSKKNKYFQES